MIDWGKNNVLRGRNEKISLKENAFSRFERMRLK